MVKQIRWQSCKTGDISRTISARLKSEFRAIKIHLLYMVQIFAIYYIITSFYKTVRCKAAFVADQRSTKHSTKLTLGITFDKSPTWNVFCRCCRWYSQLSSSILLGSFIETIEYIQRCLHDNFNIWRFLPIIDKSHSVGVKYIVIDQSQSVGWPDMTKHNPPLEHIVRRTGVDGKQRRAETGRINNNPARKQRGWVFQSPIRLIQD